MTQFEKQIQKESLKIRLRADERRLMREQLLSYMAYHPIATVPVVSRRSKKRSIPAESFSYIRVSFSSWYMRAGASAFALLLLVGVPYAAEHTVPGDVLYPVKVRVNEEVYAQLSLSPYEKIAWETRRVERRIAEARLLAKEGRLTPEAESEISEIVQKHTDEAKKGLAELHESDADEAAVAQVALESALDVQTAVLETDTHTTDGGEDNDQIRGLAEVVRNAKAGVIADGASLSASTTLPYDLFMARVEEETTRAHELFDSVDPAMSDRERHDVERRLEDVGRQISRAQAKSAAGEPEAAVTLIRGALSDAQKLIAFMTDIDVRNTVALESLVPKKLTESERMDNVLAEITEAKRIRGEAVSRVESSSDESFKEKIRFGIGELDTMIIDTETSVGSGLLVDAEARVATARALAEDLLALVGNLPISNFVPDIPSATTTDPVNSGTVEGTTTIATSSDEVGDINVTQ